MSRVEYTEGITRTYPKIQTLWKRDPENNYVIMHGKYSCEEFRVVKNWHITEKIDGMNIRVSYDSNGNMLFGGRTDKANIPLFLLDYLEETFTIEKLASAVPAVDQGGDAILFGEGYGCKIQKGGGLYRDDQAFCLFDVWIDGWWLNQDSVTDIAKKLGVERAPILRVAMHNLPYLLDSDMWIFGDKVLHEAIRSDIAHYDRKIEGIVARSQPLMLFRNGNPIMFKLKLKDYKQLRSMEASQ